MKFDILIHDDEEYVYTSYNIHLIIYKNGHVSSLLISTWG